MSLDEKAWQAARERIGSVDDAVFGALVDDQGDELDLVLAVALVVEELGEGSLGGSALGVRVIGALLHVDGVDQVCNILCGQFIGLLARNFAAGSGRACRAGGSGGTCGPAAAGQNTGAECQGGQGGRRLVEGAFSHV